MQQGKKKRKFLDQIDETGNEQVIRDLNNRIKEEEIMNR